MRNLFVLHTQYNLILALGMRLTEFSNDDNDLILFSDFNLSFELEMKIKENFDRYLQLEGNFPKKDLNVKQKYHKLVQDNKSIRKFVDKGYNRVFIVDDMCIQEMYVMKCALNKNQNVEMAWLEDGSNAYFDNGVVSGGMGATSSKRWIRKMIFSLRFGLGKCYDLGTCMGSHKLLRKAYFTFPESVREELRDKEACFVTQEAFESGMKTMYGGNTYPFEENSILIAMDKIDVYGDLKNMVNELILNEVKQAEKNGIKVYYKYHPRETEGLPALRQAVQLDRLIALESYLINSQAKTLHVIGIKSTALQTAKKLGYKTSSLIQHVDSESTIVVDFYKKIGVVCK